MLRMAAIGGALGLGMLVAGCAATARAQPARFLVQHTPVICVMSPCPDWEVQSEAGGEPFRALLELDDSALQAGLAQRLRAGEVAGLVEAIPREGSAGPSHYVVLTDVRLLGLAPRDRRGQAGTAP